MAKSVSFKKLYVVPGCETTLKYEVSNRPTLKMVESVSFKMLYIVLGYESSSP
jgi:hypothetical protein